LIRKLKLAIEADIDAAHTVLHDLYFKRSAMVGPPISSETIGAILMPRTSDDYPQALSVSTSTSLFSNQITSLVCAYGGVKMKMGKRTGEKGGDENSKQIKIAYIPLI
jgi:hypothetical protein